MSYVKSLHLGVFSLQTLIDNLLESASIETGRFRVSPRPNHLDTVLQEAVQSMQPLLEKYDQQVILEIPPDLPLVQARPSPGCPGAGQFDLQCKQIRARGEQNPTSW